MKRGGDDLTNNGIRNLRGVGGLEVDNFRAQNAPLHYRETMLLFKIYKKVF